MASEVKKYVAGEREFIKSMIDLGNFIKSEDNRIDRAHYEFFEAMILTQRELGTINTVAADAHIKALLGKPDMSRRSFRNYRNALVEKGWLRNDNEIYSFTDGFDFYKKQLQKQGTIMVTIERTE